jgi:hypothetical protein
MTPRVIMQLSLVLAACATICQAQDADITTKSLVVPGKNGRPDHRWDSTYRGSKCIMRVLSEKRASGEFVPYERGLQVGHAIFVESDEDRDGFFETLCISEDTDHGRVFVEAFQRARDGTIHPVSAEERKKIEDKLEAMLKFWNDALPPK